MGSSSKGRTASPGRGCFRPRLEMRLAAGTETPSTVGMVGDLSAVDDEQAARAQPDAGGGFDQAQVFDPSQPQ